MIDMRGKKRVNTQSVIQMLPNIFLPFVLNTWLTISAKLIDRSLNR